MPMTVVTADNDFAENLSDYFFVYMQSDHFVSRTLHRQVSCGCSVCSCGCSVIDSAFSEASGKNDVEEAL